MSLKGYNRRWAKYCSNRPNNFIFNYSLGEISMTNRISKLTCVFAASLLFSACGSDAENSVLDKAIEATKEATSEALENVKDGANSVVDKAVETTSEAASNVVDASKDAVNTVVDKTADAAGAVAPCCCGY